MFVYFVYFDTHNNAFLIDYFTEFTLNDCLQNNTIVINKTIL